MILILCLDDQGGILFNNRRQSRDRTVIKRILDLTKEKRLWMKEYSSKLFCNEENLSIDESPLKKAQKNDYVFWEEDFPYQEKNKIKGIIIYNWNRKYPGDVFFDIDFAKANWNLKSVSEFAGTSHESVREEIYSNENE